VPAASPRWHGVGDPRWSYRRVVEEGRNRPRTTRPRRWRTCLAALGIVCVVVFFFTARKVLSIEQAPSWPPGPGAITAATAPDAVREFAARDHPRASDVGMPYAWSTAATIEPWAEGKNFFPRIFDDVRRARSSVDVLMFGWREGSVGTRFADLLVQKLAEGVEVRILVDGQGSKPFGAAEPMFTRLAQAGAQIVVNDLFPLDRDGLFPAHRSIDWRHDELGRADHRKLYVIDGTIAWTGGAGLEDHFENGEFHDVMVRVTGDVVRQAQALFLTSFLSHGGPEPQQLERLFPQQPQPGAMPTALLQVTPGGFQSATQAMRVLIDHARRRLDVMNPYFTDADMLYRIEAAAARGVAVRIVVSETSNNGQATAALKHHYRDLLAAGVLIYEYPGAVVHAKLMVIDDTAVFGTVNLDAWALYRNFEVAMVARDAHVAELFEERVFTPDIARSRPGKPDSALTDRLQDWCWNTFAYVL
jgi:cardiolipin synthase